MNPVRLELGDFYRWQADLWLLVDELRQSTLAANLRVMAEIELATGRRLHSSHRRAWVVPAQLKTIKPGAPAGKQYGLVSVAARSPEKNYR
jgi:hypothetical protein